MVNKTVFLDKAVIFLFHKYSIPFPLNLQPGGASWRNSSKCVLLPQRDIVLLRDVLINQTSDGIGEKGETLGYATTHKTGRWSHVFYEYLYLGSEGCKEGEREKEEMEMAEKG